jgi:hypothetical protein
MNKSEFGNICLEIRNNPPKKVFARRAMNEEVRDVLAGEILFEVRKRIGAHATRNINQPVSGQLHSEARVNEIVQIVIRHGGFDPCPQINDLMKNVLTRRAKFIGRK